MCEQKVFDGNSLSRGASRTATRLTTGLPSTKTNVTVLKEPTAAVSVRFFLVASARDYRDNESTVKSGRIATMSWFTKKPKATQETYLQAGTCWSLGKLYKRLGLAPDEQAYFTQDEC